MSFHHFLCLLRLALISSRKGKKWKHEDASEMMFDDLVSKNDVDISEQDIRFVKALIAGEPSRCLYASYCAYSRSVPDTRLSAIHQRSHSCLKLSPTRGTVLMWTSMLLNTFLCTLANVYRFDYIARDSNATGERTFICMTRYVQLISSCEQY